MSNQPVAIGQRLRQAREAWNLTLIQAAQICGISPVKLTKLEDGKEPVDTNAIGLLFPLYNVSPNWVIYGSDHQDSNTAKRMKLAEQLGGGPAIPYLFHFITVAAAFQEFGQDYNWVNANKLPNLSVPQADATEAQVAAQIEQDAHWLRNQWGLGEAPIARHLTDILEEQCVYVFKIALESDTIAGAHLSSNLGTLICVNANLSPYQQVFAQAELLGLRLYHQKSGISMLDGPKDRLGSPFACAFLVPSSAIKRYLGSLVPQDLDPNDVLQLGQFFGVGYGLMLYRLMQLGILSLQRYQVLRSAPQFIEGRAVANCLPQGQHGYTTQRARLADRIEWLPKRYRSLIMQAMFDGVISERHCASLLNLEYEELNLLMMEDEDLLQKSVLMAEEQVGWVSPLENETSQNG